MLFILNIENYLAQMEAHEKNAPLIGGSGQPRSGTVLNQLTPTNSD